MTNSSAAGDTTIASAGLVIPTRYRVLIGALLVQLILGTVYGYSIFWAPLQTELGLAPAQSNYAFAICILSFAATMIVAGRVQDVKGPRFTALIGAVLMGAGFILAGLMRHAVVLQLAHAAMTGVVAVVGLAFIQAWIGRADTDAHPMLRHLPMGFLAAVAVAGVLIGQTYVGRMGEIDDLLLLWGTVGFLTGAGIGFAYVCPIAALIKWFPRHKGLVAGLAVAGFGFGAFLFKGEVIGAPGFIAEHGITAFFLVHGLVCWAGVGLGALLLTNPATVAAKTALDSDWQQTLRRPAFYALWVMFFSGALAGLMVIGIVAPFVEGRLLGAGVEPATALSASLTAVGVLAIFNALGRIIWGLLSDRVGRVQSFVAMFLLQAATLAALGYLDSANLLYVGAALVGFNFGGNFALFPSATADLFGSANLGANYGWVFTSYGIAGVIGIAAGNLARQWTGSYRVAFFFAAALCAVSAVLAIVLYFSKIGAASYIASSSTVVQGRKEPS